MGLPAGHRLGAFEILSLLGVGGMGEVYRARDTRLDREVAIKVLPAQVARDADRLARFEREARLLASLNHPNIAHIYGLEEAGGESFLVMELVEGPTLDDVLSRSPLPLADVLGIFTQIAEGLSAAHEAGIIHRDLKPANVKVDPDGRVKILDFGLAKALEEETENSGKTLTLAAPPADRTEAGQILGTPAYMSPEQARGEAADRRADVWAFGACLFQALSGRRPFQGRTPSDLLAALLKEEPDWDAIPAGTPPHLRSLIRRCMEKDPRRRLSSIADIAINLEETSSDLKRGPASASSSRVQGSQKPKLSGRVMLAGGAVLGLVLLVALVLILRSDASGPDAGTLVNSGGTIRSLAVLPFENQMGDPDQDYFVEGMTDALSTELGKIQALKVISQTSAAQYRGTDKTIRQIAEELKVDGLIEGSIFRAEDDVRITARLMDGRTDDQVWGDSFEGTVEKILSLQGKVALEIAETIRVAITPEEASAIGDRPDIDPRAHDLYLRGLYHTKLRTDEGLLEGERLFKEAIEIEPGFALAHSSLADCYNLQAVWGAAPWKGALEAGWNASERAIELDPSAGEPYIARAYNMGQGAGDPKIIDSLYLKGLSLNANYAQGHIWYGAFLYATGRLVEGDREIDLGLALDPQSELGHAIKGLGAMVRGRYDAALDILDALLEKSPNYLPAHIFKLEALVELKRYEEARRGLERARDAGGLETFSLLLSARIHARQGDLAAAERDFEQARALDSATGRPAPATPFALIDMGREEEALDLLEAATEAESGFIHLNAIARPGWNPVRDHPRFKAVMSKLGILDESETDPEDATSEIRKIAVLPFTSIARDDSEDWFVDGMTEALITELGKISALTVISSTSTARYRDTTRSMPDIAGELGVDALIEGSVMRAGDDIQITARLIDGPKDERLWGDFFSGNLENVFRLQGEIALNIGREIQATITPEERSRLEDRDAVNARAYEEYLRAVVHDRAEDRNGFEMAIAGFDRAIDLDPDFARAYAGKSSSLSDQAAWYYKPASQVGPQALASARKAIELDPSLSEAYVSFGQALRTRHFDWDEIENAFEKGIDLDPSNADARIEYVWTLAPTGRQNEALAQAKIAAELDPHSPYILWSLGMVHFFDENFTEASRWMSRALEYDSDFVPAHAFLAGLLAFSGDPQKGITHGMHALRLSEPDPSPHVMTGLAIAYVRAGRESEAREILTRLKDRYEKGFGSAAIISQLYGTMGETDLSVEWLKRAIDEKEWPASWAPTCIYWKPVRNDPRFKEQILRLELPE